MMGVPPLAVSVAALERSELALQSQRPVSLSWPGLVEPVAAREDAPQFGISMEEGAAVEKRTCTFFVLSRLLTPPPEIDAVLTLVGRTDRWRLMRMRGGANAGDVVRALECVEEHS